MLVVVVYDTMVLICRCPDQRVFFISSIGFLFFFFIFVMYLYGWVVFDTTDVPTKDGSVESGRV